MDSESNSTGRELSLSKKILQKSIKSRVDELIKNGNSKAPWVVELDPTTACNLACHDCISANLLNKGGFKKDRIKELAREFKEAGVRAVVLIGGGEPMAHPEFGNLVDYFAKNNIHVGVTSNGTLIRRYLKPLSKAKWVRISMDAGTSEIYKIYRPHRSGISQFDTVIEQMKELQKIKTGKLGYSFLILSMKDKDGKNITNAIDIENAANVAKEIGCDYFEVKPAFEITHFLQSHEKEVNEIVNKQLKKIRSLETENFKIISPFTLEDSLKGNVIQEKKYKKCYSAELRTVISPSGSYVCPYHRGNENLKIGDNNTQSLKEMWSGDQRKKVLDTLVPEKHCRFHCIRHETNKLLEDIIEKKKKVSFDEDFDLFI